MNRIKEFSEKLGSQGPTSWVKIYAGRYPVIVVVVVVIIIIAPQGRMLPAKEPVRLWIL